MANPDQKELWVGWTHDAMSRYSAPDSIDDNDELVDDMVEVATTYADAMLDAFEDTFNKPAGRKRKKKPVEEDED